MKSLNHTSVAILKMDVEGAEFDVIRRWSEDMYDVPAEQLLVEFHQRNFQHVKGWERLVPNAIESLKALGFELVTHTKLVSFRSLSSVDFIRKRSRNITDVSCMCAYARVRVCVCVCFVWALVARTGIYFCEAGGDRDKWIKPF